MSDWEVLAAVGLIESLMPLTLIDEITETQGNSNRECLGQGVANIVCGLIGGMGGCSMIFEYNSTPAKTNRKTGTLRNQPVDKTEHWEIVYQTKSSVDASWYEPDPKQSLDLIVGAAGDCRGRVIDIGGGQSFLVDRLLDAGFAQVAVLDISPTAIEATKTRLGERASQVEWIVADITHRDPLGEFDIWHDRAVFHFITAPEERRHYVELLKRTLPIGGHFIVGTFAKGGPEKCSGLQIRQYDAATMQEELGQSFVLIKCSEYLHTTPSEKSQLFFFGVYKREN